MRYKKTKLCLPKKGAPLDVKDLIKRAVSVDEYRDGIWNERSPKLPVQVKIEPSRGYSVGWWNFFHYNVISFILEFRP